MKMNEYNKKRLKRAFWVGFCDGYIYGFAIVVVVVLCIIAGGPR